VHFFFLFSQFSIQQGPNRSRGRRGQTGFAIPRRAFIPLNENWFLRTRPRWSISPRTTYKKTIYDIEKFPLRDGLVVF
jgi:hypothetical protein